MQTDNSTVTASIESTEPRVKQFITKKFKIEFSDQVNDDTDFFAEGLIDSYGFLELVKWLEGEFKIRFEDEELFAGNLNTAKNITQTIVKKINS
jgi:acyl carrier protein